VLHRERGERDRDKDTLKKENVVLESKNDRQNEER
jgi:hypothetical protein